MLQLKAGSNSHDRWQPQGGKDVFAEESSGPYLNKDKYAVL